MSVTNKEKGVIELEIDQMVARLAELGCDSVSIFTTMRVGRGTDTLCAFDGNYYARVGLVQDWLNHERDIEILGSSDSDDGDSEQWKENG
jgi:MoaA/NifB/PqqE/SkfB family radical SAM enzyme